MYHVEVVQHNRVTKLRIRTADYDRALDVFTAIKGQSFREIRMCRVTTGEKVLLKYLIKTRRPPKGTPSLQPAT